MKLENQCVSLEMARKLYELGCSQTSFLYWLDTATEWVIITEKDEYHQSAETYAAFTVSELTAMLPYYKYELIVSLRFYNYSLETENGDIYSARSENQADALAMLLVELIANRLVDVNKETK